jgi:hypothetical protein
VAITEVGAPGGAAGTAAPEAAEATDVPSAFVAVTVNVYDVPLVRPATVHEVDEVVHVFDPGEDVTVYPVIVDIPSSAGAVHVTTDWALPFEVAETPVGGSGTDATAVTVTSDDGLPAPLMPFTLTACT